MLQAPTGILAAEAGEDRLLGVDADCPRPGAAAAGDRHLAEAAQTDLGDATPRLDPAGGGDAGIDNSGAARVARDLEAERHSVGNELRGERRRQAVDARHR